MDLMDGIFILAVASAILTGICVGFVICAVIFFWRRDERKPKELTGEERVTTPNIDAPQSEPQDSKDVQGQLAQVNTAVGGMARQLAEIHRGIQSGWLGHTGIAMMAVGLAAAGIAYASATPPQVVRPEIAILGIVAILVGFLLQVASNFWPRKPKLK